MIKVHNITIGSKHGYWRQTDEDWAVVHACKTAHKLRLGATSKDSPDYITYRELNHLYINWVDEPSGAYYHVDTFTEALDFIDEFVESSEVLIYCDRGESRSPTLAMVYLAKRTDFLDDDFETALEQFKRHFPTYSPSGIITFVRSHWHEIV